MSTSDELQILKDSLKKQDSKKIEQEGPSETLDSQQPNTERPVLPVVKTTTAVPNSLVLDHQQDVLTMVDPLSRYEPLFNEIRGFKLEHSSNFLEQPSLMKWENLGVSSIERNCRWICSNIIIASSVGGFMVAHLVLDGVDEMLADACLAIFVMIE